MIGSIDSTHAEIQRFLASAALPALVQAGEEPIPMTDGNYSVDLSGGRLFVQAWTEGRTLSRRIMGLIASRRGAIELSIERFGKRDGVVSLVDLGSPKASIVTRRATRQTYREQFRRSLLRQFPGWRVVELSTEPDLEHSLSPAFPRALIRKGATAYAAIGCPPDALDPEAVLTFGLIWLDYLRERDRRSSMKCLIKGLALFLPEGKHRSTCLRVLHLDASQGEWPVFLYTPKVEDRVDVRDYGNVDTVLPTRADTAAVNCVPWARMISSLPHVTAREGQGGRLHWSVRGLEFARWDPNTGVTFGVNGRRKGHESNLAEIEALARELERLRRHDAADPSNPIYLRKPELWLESQIREAVREIDASLESDPVYRQAPAVVAGERDVLDLLAVDYAGRLAVLEIKAAEDVHLPLQALDYWIRVRWHAERDDFRRAGYFAGKTLLTAAPRLILVAPALQFHPTTARILRYLAPAVSTEMAGLAMDWRRRVKVMFRRGGELRPSYSYECHTDGDADSQRAGQPESERGSGAGADSCLD